MLTQDVTSVVGKYGDHASVVAANVLSFLEGKKPVKVYKGAKEHILITNGKVSASPIPSRLDSFPHSTTSTDLFDTIQNKGAAYVSLFAGYGVVLGDWFAKIVNGETLRVENVREHFGYSSP